MKSSGFNIEDTHLRDINRIARLTAMVCIALAWAYLVGEHKDINVKAIRILKHGKRAKSLIKYGLEEIANVLLRPLSTHRKYLWTTAPKSTSSSKTNSAAMSELVVIGYGVG